MYVMQCCIVCFYCRASEPCQEDHEKLWCDNNRWNCNLFRRWTALWGGCPMYMYMYMHVTVHVYVYILLVHVHVYASSVQAIHFDVVHAWEHSLVSWHSLWWKFWNAYAIHDDIHIIYSFYIPICPVFVCVCVGCEWPYGAWGLGGSHQGAHWYAANWIWQCSSRFNTAWVWVS